MRVRWLPTAWKNLDDIIDRINRDNSAVARKTAETILARVGQLAVHPHLGRPGRTAGTRELVVTGTPFIIPYLIKDDVVTILRVLHERQNWPTSI